MSFADTPEQALFRRTVSQFVASELTPGFLRKLDAEARAPHELLPKMAALGFTKLPIPTEFGGAGGTARDVAVLLEELGRGSLAVASLLNRAIGFGTESILRFGTNEQKRFFLPAVCRGDMIFAFSLTEANAGSDAAAIETRATADGDEFVISGSKMFTTGAGECPYLIVTVLTDPSAPRRKGISVFLVDATTPGITCRPIEKLGMRGAGAFTRSTTTMSEFRARPCSVRWTAAGRW